MLGVGYLFCYQINEQCSDFLLERVENEKKILGSEDEFGYIYDLQVSYLKMLKLNFWINFN